MRGNPQVYGITGRAGDPDWSLCFLDLTFKVTVQTWAIWEAAAPRSTRRSRGAGARTTATKWMPVDAGDGLKFPLLG